MAELLNDPQPGFWMLRCCRQCPEAPARIWLCFHEPGEPDNLLERPFLQGQIGLELASPAKIWGRTRRPISQAQYDHKIDVLNYLALYRPTDPRLHPMRETPIREIALPEFAP